MTLVSTVAPLAAYAVGFQTIVYLVIPARRRTLIAPLVTGLVGAILTVGAGLIFGFETIGLSSTPLATVALWTLATFAVTSAIGTAVFRRPGARAQLADPRLGRLGKGQAALQILVRIPVMTALIEEAFFRGVLHAALMALYPPEIALWGGALLFGIWHVGPGLDQARESGRSPLGNAVHTAITVLITGLGGAVLVWLRMETGSIWVPFVIHAGINMTMAFFARRAALAAAG